MSISQEQLQKIAKKLSKIPAEDPKILGNISNILDYMQLLEQVDTLGVAPTISVGETQALLREDVLVTSTSSPRSLLDCSSQKVVADQIVLPHIMK